MQLLPGRGVRDGPLGPRGRHRGGRHIAEDSYNNSAICMRLLRDNQPMEFSMQYAREALLEMGVGPTTDKLASKADERAGRGVRRSFITSASRSPA